MLGCDDCGLAGHGHDRIEIPRCQRVGKIAEILGEKRADQCNVGTQRSLDQVAFSVDVDFLLAFLDDRADPGWSQYPAESKTPGTNALDERALRDEVDGHLSVEHLPLCLRVKSDVTRDRPAYQTFVNELSNAAAWKCRIVGNNREVFLSLPYQLVDHALRCTDSHEAANHQRCTVRDQGDGILDRNRFHG